jgi:hypothetical protein
MENTIEYGEEFPYHFPGYLIFLSLCISFLGGLISFVALLLPDEPFPWFFIVITALFFMIGVGIWSVNHIKVLKLKISREGIAIPSFIRPRNYTFIPFSSVKKVAVVPYQYGLFYLEITTEEKKYMLNGPWFSKKDILIIVQRVLSGSEPYREDSTSAEDFGYGQETTK